MTKPSKGATLFFVFFGLMFLVPGLLALFTFLSNIRNKSTSDSFAAVGIALFICSIGVGLILLAVYGSRQLKKQAAVEEANPSTPWLWREDWSSRRAESTRKNSYRAAWVGCAVCALVIVPMVVSILLKPASQNTAGVVVALGLSAVGILLFAIALRASLRHRRFGNPFLEFDSLPFSPGLRFAGRIHLKLDTLPQQGVDVRLTCLRKRVTGTGEDRSTVDTVLWQTGETVPAGAIGMDSVGATIPVNFAIPADAFVTNHDNPSDQVLWQLHAKASLPGIDYADQFEVPVFRTAASIQAAANASSENTDASSGFPQDEVTAPAHTKIVVTPKAGGTEFYFPPFRNPARAIFLIIFTTIWTGVVYFLFHSKAPWLFALVFGFFDVLLTFAVFHVVAGTSRILVGNGEVSSAKRILGLGSTKHFPISDIDTILPVTSGQQGSNPLYAIRLRIKNGRRVTLVDEIASRQEARWVVAQLESLAGLKIDTHVEFDSISGPPPQPGQPLFTSSPSPFGSANSLQSRFPQAGRQASTKQSTASTLVGLAVFIVISAGMFAWQGWRFSTFKAAASAARSNANKARAAQRARGGVSSMPAVASVSVPHRAPVGAMSDEDAERILALPPQQQAEELLERAIQHDSRALDLFEQNVEEWIGHIRLTDNMRQLERRSEFSNDLRVRYANADINLTLDGWQKNEQAADMLIERAKTDSQYRAAAVYFLGMLAGRGVAYDKIHPVLLSYAKHNPDATVRQWAVEGMRYLGTKEALDELFESFTQDPVSNVRERAGCNISDCGNFTRLQRMHMVPKFLELISNPQTNLQMRAWSYMALREITDANVPADPQSWNAWYGQHGAGKLAEFERQNWWQVRGDE